MLRDEAEYGIATSDLLLMRSQGHPVVALAPLFQHSPLVFLTTGGASVSSVHDLKGKSVMREPHAAELLACLEYEGVSLKDVTIVPHTSDPSALMNGSISAMSAYSTDEPFALATADIDYMTFTPRAAGIDFYGDTLFTTEDRLRRHPDQVKRFVDATRKGWVYALEHQEEIVDLILAKYSRRHSRAHLLFEAEMTGRLILPDVVEVGYTNPERWRHIADTYIRIGRLPPDTSLQGFLYIADPKPDLGRFYAALVAAVLVITILAYVAIHFFQMNRGNQSLPNFCHPSGMGGICQQTRWFRRAPPPATLLTSLRL